MVLRHSRLVPALFLFLLLRAPIVFSQEALELRIEAKGSQLELRWQSELVLPSGAKIFPDYEIQRSRDLIAWERIGNIIGGGTGVSGEVLTYTFNPEGKQAFLRVFGNLGQGFAKLTGEGGAEVFGYSSRFAQEIEQIGQISPEEFANRYQTHADYLHQISWDPTTAAFWEAFNTDPIAYNESLSTGAGEPRSYDFRLNEEELAVFKKCGFVVSERLGAPTFAEVFYRLYNDDLPVFVSADAILHAWHRSYLAMLEELEEVYLSDALGQILSSMAERIPDAWDNHGDGVLSESILDADYFLAVGRSLLAGSAVPTYLRQDQRVSQTLDAISREQLEEFELFGRRRVVDFSQFKVRGYYEETERLRRYFKAMMWNGRIDLRVAGNPKEDSPRELGAAIVLHDLLDKSGRFDLWLEFDEILQAFVGWTDSMTFAQLSDLLSAAGIHSLADVHGMETLERLQSEIAKGQIGVQNIRGHYYKSPFGPGQIRLPRSFTVFGQKFVLDSWAFSKVVFDDIIWDEDGVPGVEDKVLRRIPSALDAAFAVFGNNQVVPELVSRITDHEGRKFRDGLPYQHNLAAVRNVVDSQKDSTWKDNIYMCWLAALRELSGPTTGAEYPESMRTRAWAMKTLNTQLASWTQLRHDTILYAKQSYTGGLICSYPAGFVEPRPRFWQRIKEMALHAAALIEGVTFNSTGQGASFARSQESQVGFLQHFSEVVGTLQGIAEKELVQESFTPEETAFLGDLIERQLDYIGQRLYSGWYPSIFYRRSFRADSPTFQGHGADKWDALVVDVHTDPPDLIAGDPGCVLHEGVGNLHLLMIAVDNGDDRMVYAGPVLSHYEFEVAGVSRIADSEWKDDVGAKNLPPNPDWTESYLIPGPCDVPPRYK